MNRPPTPQGAGLDHGCTWTKNGEAREKAAGLLREIERAGGTPIWAAIYTTEAAVPGLVAQLEAAGAWSRWPAMVLVVPGEDAPGGMQVLGTREPARILIEGGRAVGATWRDADGRSKVSICGLQARPGLSPELATSDVLERALRLLAGEGLGWGDVYRTWFYNADILSWYGEFNRVRTEWYARQAVGSGRAPASTAIGANGLKGAPITFSLLAGAPAVFPGPVRSPLQNEAMEYGSLFSRACEETDGQGRRLWVSGTAAIDARGDTQHVGDFRAQVARTYEVVGAILASRQMNWGDVSRATAYVRRATDLAVLEALTATGVLPDLKAVAMPATVCRDDLLFELELDAVCSSAALASAGEKESLAGE